LPAAFTPLTVNVYAVPLVKPETVIGDEEPVPVKPPGDEVTRKDVALVPTGVNVILALETPPVAVPIIGAGGTDNPPLPNPRDPTILMSGLI
jgi:hypothetical protein